MHENCDRKLLVLRQFRNGAAQQEGERTVTKRDPVESQTFSRLYVSLHLRTLRFFFADECSHAAYKKKKLLKLQITCNVKFIKTQIEKKKKNPRVIIKRLLVSSARVIFRSAYLLIFT